MQSRNPPNSASDISPGMSNTPDQSAHEVTAPKPATPWISYALIGAVCFVLAWLGSFAWHQRTLIAELFYQSSLVRYGVASGETGPATYYVFHNNFKALEEISQSNDGILGIELTEFSGVAAMAFLSSENDAVSLIRGHEDVKNMVQKNIPMLCH